MEDTDDMELDPEIAAAMGFTSFGNQPSSKRRKYNHNDAVTDGSNSNSKAKATSHQPTGANSMELGVRQQARSRDLSRQSSPRPEEGQNMATIHGSEVSEEAKDPQGAAVSASSIQPSSGDVGSRQKQPMASGLARFLARGQVEQKASVSKQETGSLLEPAPSTSLPVHPSLPSKPLPMTNQGQLSHEELQALRKGVKNERGDVAYFLPSFIEDPWKVLLKNQR